MLTLIVYLSRLLVLILLLVAILIAVVGSLWVLRITIQWCLEIDYVEFVKRHIDNYKKNKV